MSMSAEWSVHFRQSPSAPTWSGPPTAAAPVSSVLDNAAMTKRTESVCDPSPRLTNDHGDDTDVDLLALLPALDPDPPSKRTICQRCRRPSQVCWCPHLPPNGSVPVKSTVYILQHPFEETRCLSTTPILYECLPEGQRYILRGPRFSFRRHPDLAEVVSRSNTLLLYPASDAVAITEMPHGAYTLLVLDGTWAQASGLYAKNSFLQCAKKVKLVDAPLSQYVIRTQPKNECLSTLESVALALQTLENFPGLYEVMTRPLRALCDYQLSHGAVAHQSKQYLIEHGLYKGQKIRGNRKSKRRPVEQPRQKHECTPASGLPQSLVVSCLSPGPADASQAASV